MSNSKSSRQPETSESSADFSVVQAQARAALELRRRQERRSKKLKSTLDAWGKDFVAFAKLIRVRARENADEDGYINIQQTRVLKRFEDRRLGWDIVVKARQVYMTTWEMARDLWYFLTKKGKVVWIICQSDQKNSQIKSNAARIESMLESLKKLHPDLPVRRVTETKWVRTDGGNSELQVFGAGATEKTANKSRRGDRADRIHVTEVAFFEYADETLTALLGAVPPPTSGGEVVFESTPNGAAGFFYDHYLKTVQTNGGTGFRSHFFPWFIQKEYQIPLEDGEDVSPRSDREHELVNVHKVTPEQLKWHRQKSALLGPAKADQEFPTDDRTCWLYDGRKFFDADSLSRLRQKVRDPVQQFLGGCYKIWIPPKPDHHYIIGGDPSNGAGGDPCSAVVLDKDTGEHCATLRGQFSGDDFAMKLASIAWSYNRATIAIERSSNSWQLVEKTLKNWKRPGEDTLGYPNLFFDKDKQCGFKTSHTSRPMILDALEEAIRKADDEKNTSPIQFRTYDLEFVKEAQQFIVIDEKPQAANGAHDDLIMAMAIAWNLSGIPEGLKHTAFAPPPSISYTHTPVAFDGVTAAPSIDEIVEQQKAHWAGGTTKTDAGLGLAAIISSPADMEGF